MRSCASGLMIAFGAGFACNAVAEPIDFKGIPVGVAKAEFRTLAPSFFCSDSMPNCDLMYPKDLGEHETYAGERVLTMSARFMDEKLAVVTIRIKPESYSKVVSALAAKRGPATERSAGTVQNGFGATFPQETSEWRQDDGFIKVARYGTSLDSGTVTIASSAWGAFLADVQKKRETKAKADL